MVDDRVLLNSKTDYNWNRHHPLQKSSDCAVWLRTDQVIRFRRWLKLRTGHIWWESFQLTTKDEVEYPKWLNWHESWDFDWDKLRWSYSRDYSSNSRNHVESKYKITMIRSQSLVSKSNNQRLEINFRIKFLSARFKQAILVIIEVDLWVVGKYSWRIV